MITTFNNSHGDGDLGNADNWSNGVPGVSDTASIDATPSTGSVTCAAVTFQSGVSVAGGDFDAATIVFAGSNAVSGGSFIGVSSLTSATASGANFNGGSFTATDSTLQSLSVGGAATLSDSSVQGTTFFQSVHLSNGSTSLGGNNFGGGLQISDCIYCPATSDVLPSSISLSGTVAITGSSPDTVSITATTLNVTGGTTVVVSAYGSVAIDSNTRFTLSSAARGFSVGVSITGALPITPGYSDGPVGQPAGSAYVRGELWVGPSVLGDFEVGSN